MKKHFFFLSFVFFTFSTIAQDFKISGYVQDESTGEALIGANFSVDGKFIIQSNQYGYFSLKLKQKSFNLSVTYLGYTDFSKKIFIENDTTLNIKINSYTALDSFTVIAQRSSVVNHGVIAIPIEKIKNLPSLAGEPDLLKALTFLPGVTAGQEGQNTINVRGGSPDQNLILLDGATVYNTSHLLGFISAINPNAIKSMNLIKGGFPARYGGRLSSIIDLTMKEGNNQKRATEANIGLISSSFATEGPIKKEKSSYIFSARTAYLALLTAPSYFFYQSGKTNRYSNYFMYDINAKMNFELDKKSKLFVSYYNSSDNWRVKEKITKDNENLLALQWGNRTASLRYTRILKPNLFGSILLNFNEFRYQTNNESNEIVAGEAKKTAFENSSLVRDYCSKINFDWYPNENHTVRFGTEVNAHLFAPNFVTAETASATTNTAITTLNIREKPSALNFYVDEDWKINRYLKANIGARFANYFTGQKNYPAFEPRLALQFSTAQNSSFQLSFSKMQQPIHLLSNSSADVSNDIWIPSTANILPQQALQAALGYNQIFDKSGYQLQIEMYYKTMNHQIDFRQGTSFFQSDKRKWEDVIEKNGIGKAYGFELFLAKEEEKYSWWLSYTWSKSERKFENINKNEWYPFRYDRRHNFSFIYDKKLSKKWHFNSNFIFSTGYAVTLPNVSHFDLDGEYVSPVYTKKNNQRMPFYNRMDIGFSRTKTTKRNNIGKLTLSMYNLYGYPNALYLDSFIAGNYMSDSIQSVTKSVSLFRFIPSISYGLNFK
jgi:TonB-dependent Receptor Plug Domain/CarboxypepD_reg-like domain